MRAPRICCLDLDTFFVSVERLLAPELAGRVVIVGGRRGSPGVVTSCSYEARSYGIHSAMSMREADRLAPQDAVFLPGRHGIYGPYAERVKQVLLDFTPAVQTASIDEFYLDFSGCERLYARSEDADADATIERVVWAMRDAVQERVGLPASVGIGCTRVVSKMATRPAKPAGVIMIRAGEELAFLKDLPVRALPGIGPSSEARLLADEVRTLGELLHLPIGPLRARHSRLISRLQHAIAGADREGLGRDRPAFREHDPEGLSVGSISNERTFFANIHDVVRLEQQILGLADRVCWRARKRGVRARTITLKLRTSDFVTLTRGRTGPPTDDPGRVYQTVRALLARHWSTEQRKPVRLIGIALTGLNTPARQLALPLPGTPGPVLSTAVDELRARFGFDSVRLGIAKPASKKASAQAAPPGPREPGD